MDGVGIRENLVCPTHTHTNTHMSASQISNDVDLVYHRSTYILSMVVVVGAAAVAFTQHAVLGFRI